MPLPKVLIIGQPFNNDTGGGITLSNLFAGWDPDKLAVACSPYELSRNIDADRCSNYYQLGTLEHRWIFPFNLVKRPYPSGPKTPNKQKKSGSAAPATASPGLRQLLIDRLFIPTMEYTGLIHGAARMQLSDEFRKWVDAYGPDVLYLQASSLADVIFCREVCDYLQIPMAFHMMDDWPEVISREGPFRQYWYRRIDLALRDLLDRAEVLMSICDHMSEAYRQRYGKSFVPFHNPIELDFWKRRQRTEYELHESPVLLYAGRTGLGIDASLITVAKAVQRVNEQLGTALRLVLQTPAKPAWIDQYSWVEHRAQVPYETLPQVFAQADLLLLPYDFTEKSIKYIRYSMPTKASEFMASGTPILAFAPEETATAQYAAKFGWAKLVTENREDQLVKALSQLLKDRREREQIARRAAALAEERHDAAVVSREFQETIRAMWSAEVPAGNP